MRYPALFLSPVCYCVIIAHPNIVFFVSTEQFLSNQPEPPRLVILPRGKFLFREIKEEKKKKGKRGEKMDEKEDTFPQDDLPTT